MRNYFELDALLANTSFNSNYVAIGRSIEEATTVLQNARSLYGGSIITADPLKVYFELNKDNFYALLWFGAGWVHRLTSGVQEWQVWNDSPPGGGFLVDGSDFIAFKSPRKKEARQFRLVAVK